MDEYENLSHTTWDCKCHVVFIPKCRRRTLYLCIWRRWIAASRPKVRRIALDRAFAPSMMTGVARLDRVTLDQIVDERLHRRLVFGRAFDEADRMLVAVRVDANRRDEEHIFIDVNAVDLDRQQI